MGKENTDTVERFLPVSNQGDSVFAHLPLPHISVSPAIFSGLRTGTWCPLHCVLSQEHHLCLEWRICALRRICWGRIISKVSSMCVCVCVCVCVCMCWEHGAGWCWNVLICPFVPLRLRDMGLARACMVHANLGLGRNVSGSQGSQMAQVHPQPKCPDLLWASSGGHKGCLAWESHMERLRRAEVRLPLAVRT